MTTTTVTLAAFLEARLAEDEAAAQRGQRHNAPETFANDNYGCLLVDPARVLAGVAAKRQAIAELVHSMEADYAPWNESILRALASPYASHPDYQESWK